MPQSTAIPEHQEPKPTEHAAEEAVPVPPTSVQEQTLSDNRLIKAAQAGDPEAFGTLYERYAPTVFRYLYAHLDNLLDTEDLTDEVFLKAWRALPRYKDYGLPITAFFLRIAHNRLIDHYRRIRKTAVDLELMDDLEAGSAADPGQQVAVSLEGQELRLTLGKLKVEYRSVLVARFLSGLSPQETAQVLGKSVGAVRVLQHRALAALRKLMLMDGLKRTNENN